jgi:hypothetical protein
MADVRPVIAAHEAGHLAAALGIGLRVVSVSAAHEDTAAVRVDWPARVPCLDRAAFAAAGLAAEELLGYPPRFALAEVPGGDGQALADEESHGITRVDAMLRACELLTASPLAELAGLLDGVGYATAAGLARRWRTGGTRSSQLTHR